MILPVSAQRFCCRNRVARSVGHWGAKSAREKYKGSDSMTNFGLLSDPSVLGPSMRNSMYFNFVRFFSHLLNVTSKRSLAGYTLEKIFSGVGFSKYDESATLQKIFSGVYPPKDL